MPTESLASIFQEECLSLKRSVLQNIVLYIRLFPTIWLEFLSRNAHLKRKLNIYISSLTSATERRSAQLEYSGAYAELSQLVHRGEASTTDRIRADEIFLGNFVSFSESILWDCQREFYQAKRLNAWSVVPFEISSNRAVSRLYVDHMLSAWKLAYPDENEMAVCVVEIGAGHGVLSILMSEEFRRRGLRKSCVICTDFHGCIFRQLLELPWVRALCLEGYLDFAVCGASGCVEDSSGIVSLPLLYADKSARAAVGPCDMLVVVGNYAMDSFPVDIVTTCSSGEVLEIGLSDPPYGDSEKSEVHPTPASLMRNLVAKRHHSADSLFSSQALNIRNRLLWDMVTLANGIPTSGESSASQWLMNIPPYNRDWQTAPPPRPSWTQVHTVPISASALLRSLLKCLNPSRFLLIVGDCFMSPDHPSWQAADFDVLTDRPTPQALAYPPLSHSHVVIPVSQWFEVPFISPVQQAVALPVSLPAMVAAFSEAIGDRPCRSMCTPLHASDFSVLTLLSPALGHILMGKDRESDMTPAQICDGIELSKVTRGPSDLSNLRVLLMHACKVSAAGYHRKLKMPTRPAGRVFGDDSGFLNSLPCIDEVLSLFEDDWSVCTLMRWNIKKSLLHFLRSTACYCRREEDERESHVSSGKRRRVCQCTGVNFTNSTSTVHTVFPQFCESCAECVRWTDRIRRSFEEGHASVSPSAYLRSRTLLTEFLLALAVCVRHVGRLDLARYCFCQCISAVSLPWEHFPVSPALVLPLDIPCALFPPIRQGTNSNDSISTTADTEHVKLHLDVHLFSFQDMHVLHKCLQGISSKDSHAISKIVSFVCKHHGERLISMRCKDAVCKDSRGGESGSAAAHRELHENGEGKISKWEMKFLKKLLVVSLRTASWSK